eukprot:798908-Prorocentrum_minimum.AAC.1
MSRGVKLCWLAATLAERLRGLSSRRLPRRDPDTRLQVSSSFWTSYDTTLEVPPKPPGVPPLSQRQPGPPRQGLGPPVGDSAAHVGDSGLLEN